MASRPQPAHDTDSAELGTHLGRLDACDEHLALVATEVTGLQAELGRLQDEVEALRRRLSEREAELAERDAALARLSGEHLQLDPEPADAREIAALRATLETYERRATASDRELTRAQQRADEAWAALDDSSQTLRERSARVGQLEEELHALRLRLAAERETPVAQAHALDQPSTSAGHLRVVPLAFGHLLLERDEPCPSPSDVVEVDGTTFVVGGIGRSPLPGDGRPCAFLVER